MPEACPATVLTRARPIRANLTNPTIVNDFFRDYLKEGCLFDEQKWFVRKEECLEKARSVSIAKCKRITDGGLVGSFSNLFGDVDRGW